MTGPPALPTQKGPLAILTVTRDNHAGLLATHASLRGQSVDDYVWLVADGGSTDGTADWLSAQPAAPSNTLVWWRSAPDGGPYGGMNHALDAALALGCGHALFLNAGDQLADSDTLARLLDAIQQTPDAVLLYGDALECMGDGRILLKVARTHKRATLGMFTHHQAMIYRIGAARDLRFDPSYEIAADYAFTLATMTRGNVARLPFPVCLFASGGLSQQKIMQGRLEQARVRRLFFGHGPLRESLLLASQWAASALRRHVPAVYEFYRFRKTERSFLS
jgi:putative colanic acid biosynthesis glycosyltransferase